MREYAAGGGAGEELCVCVRDLVSHTWISRDIRRECSAKGRERMGYERCVSLGLRKEGGREKNDTNLEPTLRIPDVSHPRYAQERMQAVHEDVPDGGALMGLKEEECMQSNFSGLLSAYFTLLFPRLVLLADLTS